MDSTGGHGFPERLSVVIPAKDEEASIAEVVTGAARFASDILVMDGSSADGTASRAKASGARVATDGGRGKGRAIRAAIPLVSREVTVFMDADGSHDPGDIGRLVAPIFAGEADHVSGSRLLGGSSELHGGFDEWARLAGSSFITACINKRYKVRLSDSQNGFRAIRTDVLKRLRLRSRHTTIEQELIVKTLRLGLVVAEVPTHEYPRRAGASHISVWRDGPRYVLSLVELML
jgi:glycosyltransferase involved in cell wall biosynthesis